MEMLSFQTRNNNDEQEWTCNNPLFHEFETPSPIPELDEFVPFVRDTSHISHCQQSFIMKEVVADRSKCCKRLLLDENDQEEFESINDMEETEGTDSSEIVHGLVRLSSFRSKIIPPNVTVPSNQPDKPRSWNRRVFRSRHKG